MALQLTTAEARDVAAALRTLTAVHEFDGVDAWRTEAGAAVARAFGGERTSLCLPPCRASAAPHAPVVPSCSGEGVPPEVLARVGAILRVGVERSDDPAAADMARIGGACAAAGLDSWTGASFAARAAAHLAPGFDARRSAFVREVLAPCDLWDGPHLGAQGPGYAVVCSTSAPRLRGRRTEAGTRLLAALLQPAFAAGVRAAVARWGPPAGEPAPPATLVPPHPAAFRPAYARLTPREREVAALLAARRTNGEIATALGVSPHTARHHTERVLRKCGVSSRRRIPPDPS